MGLSRQVETNVGASLLAKNVNDNAGVLDTPRCSGVHREQARSYRGFAVLVSYLQTLAIASASKSRRVASMPATLARPELTMYTL
jgi:hypothetical protein